MKTRHTRSNTVPLNPVDDTKHVIVLTALRMFARHGIDGVSLSELRAASGQNNRSAIHYHFGNKEGLLDAVTAYLSHMLEQPMKDSVEKGCELAKSGALTIDSFVRVVSQPFITLFNSGEDGRDCIRLLSHMAHEMDDRQMERAFLPMQRYLGEMLVLLQSLIPNRPAKELAPLLFLSNCSVLESLICSGLLMREHTLAGDTVQAPAESDFIEMTLAFAQGGLLAASRQQGLSPR